MTTTVLSVLPLVLSVFKDTGEVSKMESNKEVISRLKFIGKIQKGEKVNVKFMYVQPDGIITKVSRTIVNQDNRRNTLNFVQETVNRTFEIIQRYELSTKQSDKAMCYHLIQDLKNCKKGLNNLKDTYIDDIKFCCDMDTLLQVIDTNLSEIEEKFPPDLSSIV